LVLAACGTGFFHESLLDGKVLSPADVMLVECSFRPGATADFQPLNRLLMDPVLQFQPWLEFNRAEIRQGRLPLWNPFAGCGAPHLANGQSAVFDPFNVMAYVGDVPSALGLMAATRLWVAGLGMFLLARFWGLSAWGRWFAGLVYPFCGFLILWLLYPVTPVAIWFPWLILATDRVLKGPRPRSVAQLAAVVGLVVFGGHIQTSAHLLLAAGSFALWRTWMSLVSWNERCRGFGHWAAGIALGLLLAALQILPLGAYLFRSPVWGDRQRETSAWYMPTPPRLLDAVCTAFPYAYGSQRRGHPNLARGLGVHNLNESAGGYTGLATLIWLAPLAVLRQHRRPETTFLAALAIVGAMGAFRLPPVDNLLRALPVIDVMDNRRLSLWVSFALVLLGGCGIDCLAAGVKTPRAWAFGWLAGALVLGMIATSSQRLEPSLRERAEAHYRAAAQLAPEIDQSKLYMRGERQVRAALEFIPPYYGLAACELAVLAALALASSSRAPAARWLPAGLLGLVISELVLFGYGLNPAIAPELQRLEPPVIARLRLGLKSGERAVGIGEELPPNVLMRFGLSDPRNYDSVELMPSLNWFAPLYEPGPEARTSRGRIDWRGVLRARAHLEQACVGAVVGATPPPLDSFSSVERVGDVWVAWLEPARWVSADGGVDVVSVRPAPGRVEVRRTGAAAGRIVIRETWDPGWKAWIDGKPARVEPWSDTFLEVATPSGEHTVLLKYQPVEVTLGLAGSLLGLLLVILGLTGWPVFEFLK
jgi:hypothetical protein